MTDDLEVTAERARFVVRPSRGGMLTAFEVDGARVLYMDDTTLADPDAHVRGGVPILFPSPGKLAADTWTRGDRHGSLKQHGFARDLPWRVVSSDETKIVVALDATAATLDAFPWDFTLQMTYSVQGTTLRIAQQVTNKGIGAMPFALGFHPYFYVANAAKPKTRVATAATRGYDNVAKKAVQLAGIDLTKPEVDLHLIDHDATASGLVSPAGDVRIRGSAEFTTWVVWTLAGRDFVCLEPWTSPRDALNTGEHLLELPPGETRELWLEIAFTPK
ncbi:MAG TPA: hypothetical protein VGL61_30545 [Kofleriaceae bacterium]|jgi:galactose mutarotase-like enzyme